jgi:hypothetical protein
MQFDGSCGDGSAAPIAAALPMYRWLIGEVGVAWYAATQIMGQVSEGIVGGTLGLQKFQGTLNSTIPDFIDYASNTVIEVKYVGYLSYTAQLKAMYEGAVGMGSKLQLWIGATTELSGTLQWMKDSGMIDIQTIPYLP